MSVFRRAGPDWPGSGWLIIAAVTACASAGAFALRAERPTQAVHWSEVSAVGFPAHAREVLAQGVGQVEVSEWAAALTGSPERAERAAVLLGAASSDMSVDEEFRDDASAALLARLESRVPAGSRYAIGSDIVAARALDRRARTDVDIARALIELAVGDAPHPDLAVRVECGAVALGAGHSERVVPFLLAVLRAETPDQVKSPRTWERITTLAWVKTRASMALSEAAGTEVRYRPDGSWAHQVAEANRLAERLGER